MRRGLLLLIVACGGSTTPVTTAHVEPLATASASSSSSASPRATPAADGKHVVFGPDPAGPFATTARALAAPAGPRGIVQLAGTIGRMCVLRASGEIACIASGEAWKREPITDATYMAMQNDLLCAVRKSGEVACWGTVNEAWGFHRTPTNVPKIAAATRTSVAMASACMLGRDAHVGCVGMDVGLGAGKTGKDRAFEPVEPLDLNDVVDLFGSPFDTCARERSGAVKCWGGGEHGVLGPFDSTPNGPVELVGIRGATDMSLAQQYACAVLSDGGVACWGDHYGKNDDDPKGAYDFQRIWGVGDAVAVVAGVQATCILRKTGNVVCLGYDHEGWLGDGGDRPRWGVTDDTVIPVYPEDVESGVGGSSAPRRLRKRASSQRSTKLMNVVGLADAVAIAQYGYGICALRKTGALACWGTNLPGTKIDRSNVAREVPNPP